MCNMQVLFKKKVGRISPTSSLVEGGWIFFFSFFFYFAAAAEYVKKKKKDTLASQLPFQTFGPE